jgi:uncharacterized protein (DUF4415 family)
VQTLTVFMAPSASMRGAVLRAISLRGANAREVKEHDRKPKPPADSDENPEWTEEDFARARPFKEVFPEQFKAWKRMGRPPVAAPKVHIGFRLAADVVAGIRATGKGYNARVEKVLRDALAKGEL